MDLIKGLLQSLSWIAGKTRRIAGSGRVAEKFTNVEMMQHFGFASAPPAGSQLLLLKCGSLVVCAAEEDPSARPDLSALSGSSALYRDATHYVLIKSDGSVVIKTDQPVTIDSADVRLGGSSGLKKLVHEDIIGTLQGLTLPVSGATAGPPSPGTFSAGSHATANTTAK